MKVRELKKLLENVDEDLEVMSWQKDYDDYQEVGDAEVCFPTMYTPTSDMKKAFCLD